MLDDIRIRAKEYQRKAWCWTFFIKPNRDTESIRRIGSRWMTRVLSRKGHVGGELHIAQLGPKYGQRSVEIACYVYEDVPEESRNFFKMVVDDPLRSSIILPEPVDMAELTGG